MSTRLSLALHSTSLEQTLSAGKELGARLVSEFPQGAVVLLVGSLGAGKTVLAGGIAQGIGVEERLVSPTYTIISEYHAGTRVLHHVDLYRIDGRDQLDNLGLEDILSGTGYVLVEWGEKIEPFLCSPEAGVHLRITVSLAPDGGRDIVVEEVAP
jgi:tRNA threonylcarbamoyladenosine biosynthesis protein TsaE